MGVDFDWDEANVKRIARHKAAREFPMSTKRVIPKFNSEAEEAEWWHENRVTCAHPRAIVGTVEGIEGDTACAEQLDDRTSELLAAELAGFETGVRQL